MSSHSSALVSGLISSFKRDIFCAKENIFIVNNKNRSTFTDIGNTFILLSVVSHFTTRTKHNSRNKTKQKKTKCKSDKIQKDRIQIRQNTKRQNANPTKYKKTIHKYDKTQKDKTQK